ncbi:retrovirus-related Pol polyprotein from transposon 297 [Trichonephila clavipes]|nr:retrovirus-related Pol polyprotein from transposon 297 [Trichonephila clavipes]
MDMRNNFWYFGDKPSFRIPFSKDVPLPVDDSPVEINSSSCPTNSIPSEIPLHSNTVDKTAAIQNIPSPRNLKQLQSFLQTCSWYRKFIPNFSDIARPLSNLSKKSTAWKWSEIEQQAFQTLKQCLITPPILRQVDPKKSFIIRTDASSYALGAVLLQGESPTDEQPVEYASRLLSSAEKKLLDNRARSLGCSLGLNKFRGYIEGAEITVASDHQPLKWLMNLTSPTGRLAQWAIQIQFYNLKIDYFPGKCNFIADMLSRPEYRDEKICELKTIIIDFPTRTANELRTEQLKDLELKKIIVLKIPTRELTLPIGLGEGT